MLREAGISPQIGIKDGSDPDDSDAPKYGLKKQKYDL